MYSTIDNLDPARWVPIQPGAPRPAFSLRAWFARHWPWRTAPAAFDELDELDAHMLADIGAPEPLLSRALARRERRAQELAGLHAGLAAGAWRHW